MHSFADRHDHTWKLDITIPDTHRVRRELDVDLLDLQTYEKLTIDWVLLAQVLWVLCREQAEQQNVSEEEFGRGLAGEAIDRATEALLEAVVDFFPPRRRRLLQQVHAKAQQLETASTAHVETILSGDRLDQLLKTKLDALDRELEASLAEASLSGSTSGRPPDSSGSTSPPAA